MISFTLDSQKIDSKLSKITEGLKDYTVPFREAGEDLIQYYGQQTFDNQGFNGQPWAGWAVRTQIARMQREGHYKASPEREDQILVWTGKLHRGFIKTVESMRLKVGNAVDYFKYHQQGTPNMVARKMLAINATVILMVRTRIEAYAKSLIN